MSFQTNKDYKECTGNKGAGGTEGPGSAGYEGSEGGLSWWKNLGKILENKSNHSTTSSSESSEGSVYTPDTLHRVPPENKVTIHYFTKDSYVEERNRDERNNTNTTKNTTDITKTKIHSASPSLPCLKEGSESSSDNIDGYDLPSNDPCIGLPYAGKEETDEKVAAYDKVLEENIEEGNIEEENIEEENIEEENIEENYVTGKVYQEKGVEVVETKERVDGHNVKRRGAESEDYRNSHDSESGSLPHDDIPTTSRYNLVCHPEMDNQGHQSSSQSGLSEGDMDVEQLPSRPAPNIGRYVELTDYNNVSLRGKRRGSIYGPLNNFRVNMEGSAGSGSGASSCAASSDDNPEDYEDYANDNHPTGMMMSSSIPSSQKVVYYDDTNKSFKTSYYDNKSKNNSNYQENDKMSTATHHSSSSYSSAHTYNPEEQGFEHNNLGSSKYVNRKSNIKRTGRTGDGPTVYNGKGHSVDDFVFSKEGNRTRSNQNTSNTDNSRYRDFKRDERDERDERDGRDGRDGRDEKMSSSSFSTLHRSRSSPAYTAASRAKFENTSVDNKTQNKSLLHSKSSFLSSSPNILNITDRGRTQKSGLEEPPPPPAISHGSYFPVEHLEAILCKLPYVRLSIEDIKKDMSESFERDIVTITSNHLDIIASYLGCQKIIYMEASHITTMRLNYLIIPTILITAGCSVLSGNDTHIPHSKLIISSLTALSAFLLSLISYLKLDAASEAHKTSSHQYDKLQSNVVFLSGNTLLFSQCTFDLNAHTSTTTKAALTNELVTQAETRKELLELNNKYQRILNDPLVTREDIFHDLELEKKRVHDNARNRLNKKNIESRVSLLEKEMHEQAELMDAIRKETDGIKNKIKDIKETNQFIIPRIIRYRYPIIYNSNVFTWIKKIEEYKILLMNRLVDTRNHIRQIHKCIDYITKHKSYYHENVIRLKLLELTLNKTRLKRSRQIYKDRIIYLGTAFEDIDTMFQTEIFNAELRKRHWFLLKFYRFLQCIYFFKTYTNKKLENIIKPTLNKNSILYQIINSSGVEYNDLELKWIKVVPKDINFENVNIYDKNVEYFTYENDESFPGNSFAAPMVMSNKGVSSKATDDNTISDDLFSILCCCCCEYICNKHNSNKPPFVRHRSSSSMVTYNFHDDQDHVLHGGNYRQHCHNNSSIYRDERTSRGTNGGYYQQDEDELGEEEEDATGKEEF